MRVKHAVYMSVAEAMARNPALPESTLSAVALCKKHQRSGFQAYGSSPYTLSCVWPAMNTLPLATTGIANFVA